MKSPLVNCLNFRCIGHYRSHAGYRMRGIGLVEILVAITLGVFLVGTVAQTYIGSKQTYNMTENLSRMQENYRYSMQHFARNLDAGGYAGCLELSDDKVVNTLSNQTGTYNFQVPVIGTDGTGPNSSDSVTITRAIGSRAIPLTATMAHDVVDAVTGEIGPLGAITVDATDADYAELEQYQILTISNCTRSTSFMITNDPTSSGGLIQHARGVVSPAGELNAGQSNSTADLKEIYGDGSTNSGSVASVYNTTGIRYDLQSGSDGNLALFVNNLELVSGISDLQVTYGLPVGGNTRFVGAGSITTTALWQTVESVRLTMTFNPDMSAPDGDPITKVYTKTFRVRNHTP